MQLPNFLKSRKFWAAVIGAAVIVLRHYIPNFPLSDQQLQDVAFIIVAFIIGTGLEDVGTGYAASVRGTKK